MALLSAGVVKASAGVSHWALSLISKKKGPRRLSLVRSASIVGRGQLSALSLRRWAAVTQNWLFPGRVKLQEYSKLVPNPVPASYRARPAPDGRRGAVAGVIDVNEGRATYSNEAPEIPEE